MKKTIILAAAMIAMASHSLFAQTDQGSWYVGASSNLNYTSGGGTSQTSLAVSAGNFVSDNFALGLSVAYQNVDFGFGSQDQSVIGAFGRYYAGGNVILGASLSTVSNGGGEVLGLEFGYAHFFNEHVSLEPTLNYSKSLASGGGSATGLNLALGIYF